MCSNDYKVSLDAGTEHGAYILGIIWGILSIGEDNGYWLRHRDRWYLDVTKNYLNISASVHESFSRTGKQYRLKIIKADIVMAIQKILAIHNWTSRNESERYYPAGMINDKAFIRAWTELHSSIDIHKIKTRRGNYRRQARLRIYGNQLLLENINRIIARSCNLPPKALQPTANKITKALFFQGNTVKTVINWLYDGSEIFNPRARERFYIYTIK